jgi:hypothetical protein
LLGRQIGRLRACISRGCTLPSVAQGRHVFDWGAREYLQIFKGFQQFLRTRKAAEIKAGFAVMVLRLAASMPVPAAQQAAKTFRTADCLVRVARAESTLRTALECRSTEADAREWPRSADVAPGG